MARLQLDIEVLSDDRRDRDGAQVTGTVSVPGQDDASFVGWIGLLAILQRAVSSPTVGADRQGA